MTFLHVKEPVQQRVTIVDPKVERREMFCLMFGEKDMQLAGSYGSVEEAKLALPDCQLIMLCADAVNENTISDVKLLCVEHRAVLVLLDVLEPSDMDALIEAGADHVLPLRPQAERFSVATSAAVAQARKRTRLQLKADTAQQQLADMKQISRAKMILMARHTIGEDDAHKRVQAMSMERNVALPVIAKQIIDAEELLC